jgi:PAS domain S-box-containing protein
MRILIVDDSQSDRLLAMREVRKGFPNAEFVEADGPEPFDAALAEGRIDVVITDYRMGWFDGLDVVRRVKTLHPQLPVLMLTGTGGEEVAVEAMQNGADDYILKSQLRFDRLARAVASALERAQTRAELAKAELRYGELFRAVPVGLCRCARDGVIIEANPALAALLGTPPEQLAGESLPSLFEEGQEIWAAALSGAAPEGRLRLSSGGTAWVVLQVNATPDGSDIECALTDITIAKRATEEREALLGELYHRVNNSLQMLIGMITAQVARMVDPAVKQMLQELAGRVHALSLIQQRLYETERFTEIDFATFLRDLAASMFAGPTPLLRLDVTSTLMPVNQAIPIGQAVNELLTNALKHAFPNGREGEIVIRLTQGQDDTLLEVADDGIGLPPASERKDGYGTRLLMLLMRQAGARLEICAAPGGGTRIAIRVPRRDP